MMEAAAGAKRTPLVDPLAAYGAPAAFCWSMFSPSPGVGGRPVGVGGSGWATVAADCDRHGDYVSCAGKGTGSGGVVGVIGIEGSDPMFTIDGEPVDESMACVLTKAPHQMSSAEPAELQPKSWRWRRSSPPATVKTPRQVLSPTQ